VTVESTYDGSGRPTSVLGKRGTTVLTSFNYNYKIGTQDTELRQSVSDHEGRSTTYQYDQLNRLARATTMRAGSVTEDYGYEFDADSNRTRWTFAGPETGYGFPSITYTYNAANQLLTEGGRTYTYDSNGNETRYRDPNLSGRDFTYNIRDQATRVNWTSGWTMDFAYAGEDQAERVRSGSTKFINNVLGVGGDQRLHEYVVSRWRFLNSLTRALLAAVRSRGH
jgi:YD repeat-containing protein